jgi:hypothetical protein
MGLNLVNSFITHLEDGPTSFNSLSAIRLTVGGLGLGK